MKEFNQSTKKIFVGFAKKIHYPNDHARSQGRGNRGRIKGRGRGRQG
jgi:hypothetical protein